MRIVVRVAVDGDAAALARVHVLAWQAAYAGLLSKDYLDGLDIGGRTQLWQRTLSRPRDGDAVLVATVEDDLIGFASFGPARPAQDPAEGELYAINVRPDRWGCGAGGALLRAAHDGLANLGCHHAVLWVHPLNHRARTVYEHHGWHHDHTDRTAEILGITVPETRYRRTLP